MDYKGYILFLIGFILIMVLFLVRCIVITYQSKKQVVAAAPAAVVSAVSKDEIGGIAGNLQQLLTDNCFVGDMGRILCQFPEYSHPLLRAAKPASVDDTNASQDPGCPGYVYPGIYMIEPCDDSRYNYMEDLEWDANQRTTDDFQYMRSSAEMDHVADRFPKNLYAEEMRGNDGLDAHFIYDEYVEDPYMHDHTGYTILDTKEPGVKDYYVQLYGNDPGGEVWMK